MKHSILSIVFLIVGLPWSSFACKCVPPTLASSFQQSGIVIKATVTGTRMASSNGQNRYYNARVVSVYKGCKVKTNQNIVLTTPSTTASCGIFLTVNTTYVLMGDIIDRIVNSTKPETVYVSVNRCRFRSRFNALNAFQVDHLKRLQAALPPCRSVVVVAPTKCKVNTDCNTTSQYCSNGVCRTFGTCGNVYDCINPHNNYAIILCVGYRRCTNGACGVTCGSNECPPNAPLQTTTTCPGCAATTCLTGTTCVEYNCGQCKSFCF